MGPKKKKIPTRETAVITPGEIDLNITISVPNTPHNHDADTEQGCVDALLGIGVECGDTYPDLGQFVSKTGASLTGWVGFCELEKTDSSQRKTKARKYTSNSDAFDNDGFRKVKSSGDRAWPGGLPLWKSGIETVTFRYIPNNGVYRGMKYEKYRVTSMTSTIQDNVQKPCTRVLPEKTAILSKEQRTFQREIQRDLQKEFDTKQAKNDACPKTDAGFEAKDKVKETTESDVQDTFNFVMKRKSEKLNQHPLNLPLCGKSISERLLERLNTRICVIDEEIKRDHKASIRRSSDSGFSETLNASNGAAGKQNNSKPCALPHAKLKDRHVSPGSSRTEVIAQDTFSVKQIPRGELSGRIRPKSLETLTQRGSNCDNAVTQIKYTTSAGDVISIPLYSHLNSPLIAREQDRSFYLDTMSSAASKRQDRDGSLQATLTTLNYKSQDEVRVGGGREPDDGETMTTTVGNGRRGRGNKRRLKNGRAKNADSSIPEEEEGGGFQTALMNQETLKELNTLSNSVLPQISGKGMLMTVSLQR